MSETPRGPSAAVRQLFVFFALAYFAQGISQEKAGMLNQTLKHYYRHHEHMSSQAIADFGAPLMIPWVIKPLYGLISDLLPLGRYRRKSYLVLTCLLAILGFAGVLFAPDRWAIRAAIFVTSLGIAFGDVLVDALMVENGQRTGYLRFFQGVQWQWVSIAGVGAALIGGQLSEQFAPMVAVRIAASIAMVPIAVLLVAGLKWVHEDPSTDSRREALVSMAGLRQALRSLVLWRMALIVFLVNFAPNAGTALYVYLSDVLHIPQGRIGISDAVGAFAGIAGAAIFNKVVAGRYGQRRLMVVALLVSVVGTLPTFFIRDFPTVLIAALLGGSTGMVATLAMLSLAGESVPARAEGFCFAALMSISNQAVQWGDQIGARIFDRAHQQLWPLILANIATTLVALLLARLLPDNRPTPLADAAQG